MAFILYVYTYKFGIFIAKISNITVGRKNYLRTNSGEHLLLLLLLLCQKCMYYG